MDDTRSPGNTEAYPETTWFPAGTCCLENPKNTCRGRKRTHSWEILTNAKSKTCFWWTLISPENSVNKNISFLCTSVEQGYALGLCQTTLILQNWGVPLEVPGQHEWNLASGSFLPSLQWHCISRLSQEVTRFTNLPEPRIQGHFCNVKVSYPSEKVFSFQDLEFIPSLSLILYLWV